MKIKFIFGLLLITFAVLGITLVLSSEDALIFHPKGLIAHQEKQLIIINTLLMLVIIIPTYILLFIVVWKYFIQNKKNDFEPNHTFGLKGELLMWILPAIIVAILGTVTWFDTHQLNPYKPIESKTKPLVVQVVAMDWKWLFIYPEQGIAALNYLHIPEKTPIHLWLTADQSPMNSFWIPQLSGQIYSMTGMSTQLNLMADGVSEYMGRAVEINGEGYADMTFPVKSSSQKEFEDWISQAKKSTDRLTQDKYNELIKPEVNKSQILFSEVDKDLYHKIVQKYMFPAERVL